MSRHRRTTDRSPLPPHLARQRLAAALTAAGAIAATVLAITVQPSAPPAPDRLPDPTTSEVAQLRRF
ncbi:hypothetical protein DSC45_13860 [Streptomyces sp. YIM 130001]|uniref:hypothetical protein n=1 Tax=Streptomyces sp. YIM 130001 TaxID=2259644 RepID=UPI000E658E2B|nr:hypothetical protein [Streptomyces sp. YIM 130001]RII17245.1 hypothetical protein DSC45_13860 [Streptomyces sp. YIM 130001]